MTTLPRCPFPGCPVRYRGGPDRECPDHQNEFLTAAAELGIDLPSFSIPPPEPDVSAGQGGAGTRLEN